MPTNHDFAIMLSHATLQEQHDKLGRTLLQHPAKRIHHCLAIVASSFLHNQAETFQKHASSKSEQVQWVCSWFGYLLAGVLL